MGVFEYAPAAESVDGLIAVPIHIDQITASMVFDGATKTAHCSAVMQFTLGPASGHPIFDLRQTVTTAVLDGGSIPVADLAHHDFGGGMSAALRIIERSLAAGSSHTLELGYDLDTPDAPSAREIKWESSSARLSLDFHLSDLNPGRYLESWLPSNLLFDTFPVQLEIQIVNTSHDHTVLSNGTVTDLSTNHWQVDFPAEFTSCSPMLLIEATDRVALHSSVVALGGSVTLELMKRASDVSLDLASAASIVAGHLDDFDSGVGAYMHGDRFVAYLTSGPSHSMEYDGGTTSSMGSLKHEVFHSWWARGMVPARAEDGWVDEAWTTYNTQTGGPDATPLDPAAPPVALWTGHPFKRKTHGQAYGHGSDVFAGIAADVGISALIGHMSGIYQDRAGRRFTTPEIEAELIRRSGALPIARHFDRFVYGFSNPAPGTQPDLYLRDATDDTGDTPYPGSPFWRSPDVWVRNADDGGTTPQSPESGQDNWLHARVHNRGTATAGSFVVGFKLNIWAGTQFVYPGDWFPLTAVAVGFDLSPGDSRIVKARWRKEDIPPVGSHGCLLAMACSPHDPPTAGAHVWEHNNLAQRNLTIVNAVADDWIELAFWVGNRFTWRKQFHSLELVRPKRWPELEAEITHRRPEVVEGLFRSFERLKALREPEPRPSIEAMAPREIRLGASRAVLRPAEGSKLRLTRGRPAPGVAAPSQATLVPDDAERRLAIRYDPGRRVAFPVAFAPAERKSVVLRLKAPRSARPGDRFTVDLVQRDVDGRAVGGFTVEIRINRGRRDKS